MNNTNKTSIAEQELIRNRNMGEVYTPSKVANLLYKATQEVVPDFNLNSTVWDCCWGTGNLTKEFEFNDLYCSTLRAADIRKNRKNNAGANKFAYDFLNEDVEYLTSQHSMLVAESGVPDGIQDALINNKPLHFYINPPYVTTYSEGNNKAGGIGLVGEDDKGTDTSTEVKKLMLAQGLGRNSDQLYIQFLYKIMRLKEMYGHTNITVSLISPTMYITSATGTEFRDVFLKEFKLSNAYLFPSTEFKGLSGGYGLSITIWESGEQKDKTNFPFKVLPSLDADTTKCEEKNIYNLDNETSLTEFLREQRPAPTSEVLSKYVATSGVRITTDNFNKVATTEDSLGYYFYKSNNNYHHKDCGIISIPYRQGGGVILTKDNLDNVMPCISARVCNGRYLEDAWIHDKDEYLAPNTKHPEWRKLVLNSYLHMMFSGQTHIASLVVGNEVFPNKLFHLSYEYMTKLYEKQGADIKDYTPDNTSTQGLIVVDRLAELFNTNQDLPYAKELYQAGLDMWESTMERRLNGFADAIYQVEHWDAGFYQVKQLTKDDNRMEKLKEFNKIVKEYDTQIREYVRKVGYLR